MGARGGAGWWEGTTGDVPAPGRVGKPVWGPELPALLRTSFGWDCGGLRASLREGLGSERRREQKARLCFWTGGWGGLEDILSLSGCELFLAIHIPPATVPQGSHQAWSCITERYLLRYQVNQRVRPVPSNRNLDHRTCPNTLFLPVLAPLSFNQTWGEGLVPRCTLGDLASQTVASLPPIPVN